jgi:peptide/nickel transport system permease protein
LAVAILRRIVTMIPILLFVSILLFFIMNILPGDAAAGIAGENMSPEQLEQLREDMGLNRPPHIRYLDWIGRVLRGDFGKSLLTKQPISEKLALRFPVTLELTLIAMIIAIIVALPSGIASSVKRNSPLDMIASVFSMLGVAIPPFWLGMLLILLFAITLGWIPASGYVPFFENPSENLIRMIMPAVAIGVTFAAEVMRQTRSSMLEVLDQDYIVTAKSKGLSGRIVIWKHALRNALIPVITVIAMQVGRLFGGAVIAETVFAIPGMGSEIVRGIVSRDYPVVMSFILIIAAIVVAINTFVDVIYIIIDPRISHGKKR